MIECKPIGGRHPMRYLSYDRLALPGICSLEQNNAGNNFELGNCQASRSGTWFFTVEMDTDIQYEVKAYLVGKPLSLNVLFTLFRAKIPRYRN